jgi:parvulin-like peptidyl-prolyl isomerase
MMKKTILALALALTTVTASAAELLEGIVVRVGDRIITRTQYERRLRDLYADIERTAPPERASELRKEARENLVNELISELLIKDRADRIGVTVSDAELADSVDRLKQQYGITTDEQFDASLRQSGLDRATMEARLRETLITQKVFSRELRNRTQATDAELRERYNREKESYRLPERAQLREIVILKPESGSTDEAQTKANEVAEAARKAGTDFANLASTMSESGTREKGGEMGLVAKGDLIPALDTAIFNATPGSIIGPIETKSAWHIMKVEQRLPSEVPGFDTVREKLRQDESEESFNRDYKNYIDTLRRDAYVQINEKMIPQG